MRWLGLFLALTMPSFAQSSSTYPLSLNRPWVASGISAAGATRATATPLTADFNEVTVVASGTGVSLNLYNPSLYGVQRQDVLNAGANLLLVYPPSGVAALRFLNGSTDALSPGSPTTLAPGSTAAFFCLSATLCYVRP